VGKTTFIQAIFDACHERDWVKAAVFLSHVNRLDDNSRIIATISYQIALKSPPFMDAIGKVLENDPKLFERNLSSQFNKLITEPSKVLRPRISLKKNKPLVIIIDGLDQCMDAESQLELLQLIDDSIRRPENRCPFKWIISGRPVAHWFEVLSRPDNQHLEMSMDDPEAIEDVKKHIIEAGFRDILRQNPHLFGEDGASSEEWPTMAQAMKLANTASGSFMVASCMLQFIADPARADPKGQLQRCLEFIDDPRRPRENNPLSPLYLVYQHILSNIKSGNFTATSVLQILAVEAGDRVFEAQDVAISLNLDLSALYRALDGLQSVLKISPIASQGRTIEFYHPSFVNFLQHRVDPSRTMSLTHIQEVSAGRTTDDGADLGKLIPDYIESMALTCKLVLAILLPCALIEADFDSPSRYPPPRCHPNTRTLLRQKTSVWFTDAECREHILWVTGPPGSGKTAFAQSLAESCHQTARLGASLFLSHTLKANDYAQRVIPSLACQLAAQFPDYNALISLSLMADPLVLEKDLRSQFQQFIVVPFQKLQKERRLYSVHNSLVIILDGLDTCGSKAGQIELTRLISQFSKDNIASSGLYWVVCTRPESHIKKIIQRMTLQSLCLNEELLIEDAEARDDVELMLRDGFYEIRKQYFFRFGPTETWPTDVHWHLIKHAASGFFKFARCILQYVGDEDQRDPRALLELCLGLVNSSLVPHTLHPFHSLDKLYDQIILSIPLDVLPTTLRILSLCIHASGQRLLVRDIMAVLNIGRPILNDALDGLHSVIIFSSSGTHNEQIGFFHHSFPDFLGDPKRSGQIAREINMETTEPPLIELEAQSQASSSKVTLDKGKGKMVFIPELSAPSGSNVARNDDRGDIELVDR
jgi:Cdc6-like AAA superfamily ATPase